MQKETKLQAQDPHLRGGLSNELLEEEEALAVLLTSDLQLLYLMKLPLDIQV